MKLISNRHYFDYNSSSPLSKSVKDFFHKGDFFFANPSSQHTSGKKSAAIVDDVRDYLYQLFKIDKDKYSLIFHSGATEGISLFVRGIADFSIVSGERISFIYASTDHPAVKSLASLLHSFGHDVSVFSVDRDGNFNQAELIKLLESKKIFSRVILNWTYVHNEIGSVWRIEKYFDQLQKTNSNLFIHVDATQLPGKILSWKDLDNRMAAYTFSGHKFGALKGIGFSFISKVFSEKNFLPLFKGGSNQDFFRGGTLNLTGIQTLKLALMDLEKIDLTITQQAFNYLLSELKNKWNKHITIVAENCIEKNLNTLLVLLNGVPLSQSFIHFDLAKFDVGVGSACSSGINLPNETLLSMGFSKEDALSAIRFSFPFDMTEEKAKDFLNLINIILQKF